MSVLMVLGLFILVLASLAFVTEADTGWVSIPIAFVALLMTSIGYAYFESPVFRMVDDHGPSNCNSCPMDSARKNPE
jgi:membrane protein implicated in regulation of membrane protease activity